MPWLIREAAITHLPSATVLVALRHLPGAGAGRKPFLAFADPVFNRDQLRDLSQKWSEQDRKWLLEMNQ